MIDAAERGSLTIAPGAVEKVAEYAALHVSGVASANGSALSRSFGRSYPRVEAEVAGDRAVLDIEIAAVWPTPIPALANEVVRSVREQVQRCAGVRADRINVKISHVAREVTKAQRRVE